MERLHFFQSAQIAAPSEDQVINHNQETNVTANVTSQWVVSVKVPRLPERKRIMSIKGVKQIWGGLFHWTVCNVSS